ncbi:MAG: glycosyltransferase family 1 protein [Candidatus Falkowbacteria bacterium]
MKIGIDIRTLMDKHYSGVSEYTFNLLNYLMAQDTKNDYALFYNSFRDISSRMPQFTSPKVKVIHSTYPNKIFNYLLQKFLKQPKVDEIIGGCDIFLSPHINFLALSPYCKKVITIHDLSFLRYPEFFSRRKNFWHKSIRVEKMISKFDKIVAVSENTKNDLIELCDVPAEKIQVIYSGLAPEYKVLSKDDPRLKTVRAKYDLPAEFILYLGNIEPRKNIAGLIRAYNTFRGEHPELSAVKLIIAGATGWRIKETFTELHNSPYLADIKFLGYVDREDKVFLYNCAKIFVYPSFYEGFGFPPLEAMACGVPVVTSNISSLPEIVGAAAMTVDPNNINAIAEAMAEVLKTPDLYNALAARGVERAQEFDWNKTAAKYLELFTGMQRPK